ncbi:conserved hypothetical protein [Coccidioides posadasii str. Silveira]|uniref:Uncharacterized protein n=2 Tax=Coccidioides posadasii TaxID=199306 RepID=E9DG69_COCPS|nr:conserved hypothetical protein [Coccidioides posadasii str. Silveira]KMM68336.1 hypothetical protein CPAG_04665 [Coccidioides posadasii RMSCC 3488]
MKPGTQRCTHSPSVECSIGANGRAVCSPRCQNGLLSGTRPSGDAASLPNNDGIRSKSSAALAKASKIRGLGSRIFSIPRENAADRHSSPKRKRGPSVQASLEAGRRAWLHSGGQAHASPGPKPAGLNSNTAEGPRKAGG